MIFSPAARSARPVSVMSTMAVDDVGHLGLGGAVGEADVGLDALRLEEPPGQLGVLGRHPHALAAGPRPAATGESPGTATTMRTGLGGGLGVVQLAERDDVAARSPRSSRAR